MAATLRSLGIVLMLGVIGVALLVDMLSLKVPFLTNHLYFQVGGLGAFMFAAGVVLRVLGGATSKVVGKRCPRCGKRVEKNQIYCRDHQKLALEELRDGDRSAEDTQFTRKRR